MNRYIKKSIKFTHLKVLSIALLIWLASTIFYIHPLNAQAVCNGLSGADLTSCSREYGACQSQLQGDAERQCVERVRAKYTNRTTTASTGSSKLDDWLEKIINVLSAAVGIVVVGSLIFAGFQYMTARDNASQVSAAKNRILMAVLALLLYAFAYAVLQWLIPGGIFNK